VISYTSVILDIAHYLSFIWYTRCCRLYRCFGRF